jgi:short-subunit dehydrogenase
LQRVTAEAEVGMRIKLKKLQDQVIVITGASSGIGLATAEMAARRGASVVLNSRNEADLSTVAERIRQDGGRATYVVGDVADDETMQLLAQRAIDEFGALDTWVNNAGIGLYGRLEDVSMADKRRLFDVNFWGVVNGCKAAVRVMRMRGSGAIINIGSIESERALPLHGIYAASKHAVKGYTDALRMELEADALPISVTLVKPASIATPFTEHARNYMDEEAEYMPPVYAPETVARTILRCAERPTRDIIVGGSGKLISMMEKVAPRTLDRYLERSGFTGQKQDEPVRTGDALYTPEPDGQRRGRTTHTIMERSSYTRAAMSDVARLVPVIALGAVLAGAVHAMRKAG